MNVGLDTENKRAGVGLPSLSHGGVGRMVGVACIFMRKNHAAGIAQ